MKSIIHTALTKWKLKGVWWVCIASLNIAKNKPKSSYPSIQCAKILSSRFLSSSFHDSHGPVPEVHDGQKMPFDRTSWRMKRCIPLCFTACSKSLTMGSEIWLIKADTAPASAFPIPKAFAIPVACSHSCIHGTDKKCLLNHFWTVIHPWHR